MENQLSFFAQDPSSSTATTKKQQVAQKNWTIFIDGAARGNPGPAGAGVYVIRDSKGVHRSCIFLGKKTNNQAEYFALMLGVFLIKETIEKKRDEIDHVTITSDSELLIKQMQGLYRIKNPILKILSKLVKDLLEGISHTFRHVLREENKQADALANKAIDDKVALPDEFAQFLSDHRITV